MREEEKLEIAKWIWILIGCAVVASLIAMVVL